MVYCKCYKMKFSDLSLLQIFYQSASSSPKAYWIPSVFFLDDIVHKQFLRRICPIQLAFLNRIIVIRSIVIHFSYDTFISYLVYPRFLTYILIILSFHRLFQHLLFSYHNCVSYILHYPKFHLSKLSR